MTQTQQQDSGLLQRGLLLLGGMTALVVIVLLIVLRGPESPSSKTTQRESLRVPVAIAVAPFPATPSWPLLVSLNRQLPSTPGWEIRYNAAVAMARRGSSKTPWPVIHEMIDQEMQQRNFVVLKGGQIVPHEEDAQRTVHGALIAVAEWHKKQDRNVVATIPAELQLVYDQVDRLANDPNTMLRVQADRTRQTFFRK